MAKLNDEMMRAILADGLAPGETLTEVAYGVRQPNMLYMLPLFALAVLPGVIVTQMLTKHYVAGLSASTLHVAEVKPRWSSLALAVKSVVTRRSFDLATLKGQQIKTGQGALFTRIAIGSGKEGWAAKFHRAFSKTNRSSAEAIKAAVEAAAAA
ncbi:hypothetical protein [Frigidibacter sp. ROC022]|uniref:hypothetical protein n=1 Tax=Frigidibacter sp. ROC022 TaxID=2971796 RepID=UPI00215ACD61|nr:hypothetical protein [Frigidibacter sp. ROC022]MCR8726382.1 hypothetical protein [Frigidibacter sp. ROC022]